MIATHAMWMFHQDEMRLFREGEEIPAGWYDAPSKFNGADPNKFDHDHDSRPGGSAPAAAEGPPIVDPAFDRLRAVIAAPAEVPIKRGPGRPRKVVN